MFNKQNFCHVASNNRNEQKAGIFVYKTTDDLQTVLQSGYFNEKIIDINLHDLIIHEQTNATDKTIVERNLLCVVERTLENVGTQLIQSNWEKTVDETIDTIIDDIKTIQNDIADIKEKNEDQDDRLDALEQNVAYKATDFVTPITNDNKGITQTEETAINNKINLAANSGDQLTDKGVWYAKMYAATVAPAAEDGTNYADFSQMDTGGNPIIVLYERQNGAWVQTNTITPPAEYNGYVTVTSKIWDIVEQDGQQGGKVLWAHNTKTFTPYPQIISFEDIEVTGESTVIMPQNPSANQIVNKDYVDNHIPTGNFYHPDLFDVKWADHQVNDVQWLRADTFSWQSGAVYQAAYAHLADDIDGKTLQSETIAGITIQFYLADDGHKICPVSEESNVAAIYSATGVAWYYIIDTTNQRFKLPRSKHNKYADTAPVIGNGMTLGLTDGTINSGLNTGIIGGTTYFLNGQNSYGTETGSNANQFASLDGNKNIGITTDPTKSGMIAQQEQDTDQYKYLYFYVGAFTQTAIENTAGLNTELFNGKAGIDLDNVSTTGKATAVGWSIPDTTAGINIGSYATYTFDSDGWLMITTNTAASVQYTSDKYTVDQYSPFHYGCLCPAGSAFAGMYPVQSGEIITKTYGAGNYRVMFYPSKGVNNA